MVLTHPLQALEAILRHKDSTLGTIDQKSSKNYSEGNIVPAPKERIDWCIQMEMLMSDVKSSCTNEEIAAWLRGLLTVAWADGNFDEDEQKLIASLASDGSYPISAKAGFEPIPPAELAAVLGKGTAAGENFLRTAVMVALADGTYSFCEDEVLYQFCTALGHSPAALESLRHTIEDTECKPQPGLSKAAAVPLNTGVSNLVAPHHHHHHDVLQPVKNWLDGWEVHDPRVAHFVCKMIPPQCPFERDIVLFGRKIVHVPPMCKINPLYEQLVGMRFRALSYLADDCKEDISQYC